MEGKDGKQFTDRQVKYMLCDILITFLSTYLKTRRNIVLLDKYIFSLYLSRKVQ